MTNKKNSKGESLQKILINVVLQEHQARRDMLYKAVKEVTERIGETMDEADIHLNIEYINELTESSIKNDGNIVKLIELLLKYEYDDEDVEGFEDIKNKLSDNKLNIDFDQL